MKLPFRAAFTFVVALAALCSALGSCKQNLNVTTDQKPTAPANIVTTPVDGGIRLSWSVSASATSYTIYWKKDSTVTTTDYHGKQTVAAPPCTIAPLDNGATYAFCITAKNDGGESVVSTVVQSIPSPLPSAPLDLHAAPALGSAVITWASVSGATYYTLYYIAGATVAPTTPGVHATASATSPYTVNGLGNGTQYAFTVTASNGSGEGPAAASVIVTPGNQPPVFGGVAPFPADNETAVPLLPTQPVLSWPGAIDPEGITPVTYDLYIGANTLPGTTALQGLTSLSFNANSLPLTSNTVYKWKVVAKDNLNNQTSSPTWTFNTMIANPSVPSVPSPADVAGSVIAVPATLSWSASTCAANPVAGNAITKYVVAISSDYAGDGFSPITVTSGTSTPVSLAGGRLYTWSVTAYDAYGGSTAGPSWHFRTRMGTPSFTQSTTTAWTINIQPAAMPGATSYAVYLNGSSTAVGTVTVGAPSTPPAYTISGLSSGTQYAIVVKAISSYEASGVASASTPYFTHYLAPTATNAFYYLGSNFVQYQVSITNSVIYPAGTVWHYSLYNASSGYWYTRDTVFGSAATTLLNDNGYGTTYTYPNYSATLSIWGFTPSGVPTEAYDFWTQW